MTNDEMEAKLESLQRQCDKLFSLHGLQPMHMQEKQAKLGESDGYIDSKGHYAVKPSAAHEQRRK
jgi:hypothetical protein